MTDLPIQDPAIPSPRADVVPTSPDVVATPPRDAAVSGRAARDAASGDVSPFGARARAAAAVASGTPVELQRLMTAFRILQMHHARVLHHESTARGLNATDVRFVFFLSASDDAGVTPKQAGEYLELSTGAMTSLVDRLANRGHIERRPNPEDRRSVLLHLTPSGGAVAAEIGALYQSVFRDVVTPELRSTLADVFEELGDELQLRSREAAG